MELTFAHWVYLAGTAVIIITMLCRQNVVVPAIVMTFLVGWTFSDTLLSGLQTIFNASLVAAGELFNIFLIIAIMTALLSSLKSIQADVQMIIPFQKVMKGGSVSFWVIVLVTYSISLFFWPTPAVPLVAALLVPVAIRAGLPPIGAAIAISLAGQGMALSSDYVSRCPMLSAASAGVDVSLVADRAFVLSLITGGVALTLAYMTIRKSVKAPSSEHLAKWEQQRGKRDMEGGGAPSANRPFARKFFAIIVPLTFLLIIIYMASPNSLQLLPRLKEGQAEH